MNPFKMAALVSVTAFTLVSAGCNNDVGRGPDDYGPDAPPADPDNPDKPGQTPPTSNPTAKYSGIYQADAPIDFTQNGVLPGAMSPILAALSTLHTDPGKSIIDIVEMDADMDGKADLGAVGDAVKDLPGFVKTILKQLITDEVNKFYAANPTVDKIAEMVDGITDLTKTINIKNSLTVHTPNSQGASSMELQTTAVGFELLGSKYDVMVPAASKPAALAQMPGTVAARPNAPVADADLTIGGGALALPMGDFLLQAAGPLLFQPLFGAPDLKSALLTVVPCASIATAVTTGVSNLTGINLNGVLPGLVQSACTAGVGAIADKITGEIQKIVFDDIKVSNAKAVLYDVSTAKPQLDNQSDRVAEGVWTWSFTLGNTPADVPSTFAGDRIGNAL